MIGKPFDRIQKEDIDSLISNAAGERKTLEYKEHLPGKSDGEKKEFLADVSSFANASGGDILFGVVDKRDANGKPTGIPDSAPGLAIPNADAEIQRLESMVRDGIQPRIAGFHVRPIEGFTQGPVLFCRIQKSHIGMMSRPQLKVASSS